MRRCLPRIRWTKQTIGLSLFFQLFISCLRKWNTTNFTEPSPPSFPLTCRGFLRGHSCCSALIKMTDDWRLALDRKNIVGTVAIDLSKAFDSICNNLLLAILRAYGVSDTAVKFLCSYLEGRKQRVKTNGVYSDWSSTYCGVPQGSLLGPFLFNVFINDLNYSVNISSLRLYADDTTEYYADTCPAVLEFTLNQELENCPTGSLETTSVTMNSTKTQVMIFQSSTNKSQIERRDSLKILGVTLDRNYTLKTYSVKYTRRLQLYEDSSGLCLTTQ